MYFDMKSVCLQIYQNNGEHRKNKAGNKNYPNTIILIIDKVNILIHIL